MTTDDIRKIIKDSGKKVINVSITTQSDKVFRQSLRINDRNQLCIGSYKSSFPNYIISDNTITNWKNIKPIK